MPRDRGCWRNLKRKGLKLDLPAGTRNYTYAQDMAIFRTRTHWVLLAVLFAFLFTAPLYWGNYWLGVANLIGITIIAATGLNILTGYCGQLSIGHAGFIAVGAYLPGGANLCWVYSRANRDDFWYSFPEGQGVLSGNLHYCCPVYHHLGSQSLDRRNRRF